MAHEQKIWGIHPADDAERLEQLVHSVYAGIGRRPADLAALKQAIVALLAYLASPEGRTDRNCTAVDIFFCVQDGWEIDWDHLPVDFQRILEDMGGTLHDTVSSPNIARNFESTPEQLLNRIHGVVV